MQWDRSARVELPGAKRQQRIKVALIWLIIALTVLLPTAKMVLLRHENLPQSYSHDGGVIQTEAAVDFFLAGRNPYVEDYRSTPMAEWGLPEFRTALDHYPYLPWTYVFSAPVKVLSDALLGWYDQRFVYLLVFVVALLLATRLVPSTRPRDRLGLLMLLGLNPLMGLDLIFGQNDLFVWAWIVLALWLLARPPSTLHPPLSTLHSPPPPLLRRLRPGLRQQADGLVLWRRFLPCCWCGISFTAGATSRGRCRRCSSAAGRRWRCSRLLVGPYLVWNANALVDDVWRWAAGTTPITTRSGAGGRATSCWPLAG